MVNSSSVKRPALLACPDGENLHVTKKTKRSVNRHGPFEQLTLVAINATDLPSITLGLEQNGEVFSSYYCRSLASKQVKYVLVEQLYCRERSRKNCKCLLRAKLLVSGAWDVWKAGSHSNLLGGPLYSTERAKCIASTMRKAAETKAAVSARFSSALPWCRPLPSNQQILAPASRHRVPEIRIGNAQPLCSFLPMAAPQSAMVLSSSTPKLANRTPPHKLSGLLRIIPIDSAGQGDDNKRSGSKLEHAGKEIMTRDLSSLHTTVDVAGSMDYASHRASPIPLSQDCAHADISGGEERVVDSSDMSACSTFEIM